MPLSGDPDAAARQRANLIRGQSSDPAARERQLANLRRGRQDLHHAYAADRLAPLTEQHDVELAADYPAMDRRRRALLADRLARVELASVWVREHGITPTRKGKGHGETWPIVDRLERWSARCEDMLAVAEAQRRESGASPAESLEAIVAELSAGDDDGDDPAGGHDGDAGGA